ncbi:MULTISPECIES: hypothetical protein [Aquimarina]|uniref:hypothetical protein n=1 Tax=Aquimarina TaxID=290174 RepID=UPI00094510C7|nr:MULTISPECIES: hypothetical protein [Aquimarina]
MKSINTQIIVALCTHLYVIYSAWSTFQTSSSFIIFGLPKFGANMFLIGCVMFFPIVLIGIYGSQKLLNTINKNKLLNNQKPTKAYRMNPEKASGLFLSSVLLISIYYFYSISILLPIIIILAISFIFKVAQVPIIIYPEYIEIKLNSFGLSKFIKKSQISTLDKNKEYLRLTFLNSQNTEQSITFQNQILNKEDLNHFIEEIEKSIKQNRAKSS